MKVDNNNIKSIGTIDKITSFFLGALTFYSLTLLFPLALHVLCERSLNDRYFGHSDFIGPFLSEFIGLLFMPIPIIIILFAGGAFAYTRTISETNKEKKTGCFGKILTISIIVVSVGLVGIDLMLEPSIIRYTFYSKSRSRIDKTTKVEILLSVLNDRDRNSLLRLTALGRLGSLIKNRMNRVPNAQWIEFSHPRQEQEVFQSFVNALEDPDKSIKAVTLEYIDDLVKLTPTFGKLYLTGKNTNRIRQAYLKAIADGNISMRKTAFRNIGNLPGKNDEKAPLFYKQHLLDFVFKHQAGEIEPIHEGLFFWGNVIKAMNRRPADFLELEDWVIELVNTCVYQQAEAPYWQEMIKFLLSINSQKGREALRKLLKKDIDPGNKQLILDSINGQKQGR